MLHAPAHFSFPGSRNYLSSARTALFSIIIFNIPKNKMMPDDIIIINLIDFHNQNVLAALFLFRLSPDSLVASSLLLLLRLRRGATFSPAAPWRVPSWCHARSHHIVPAMINYRQDETGRPWKCHSGLMRTCQSSTSGRMQSGACHCSHAGYLNCFYVGFV